MSISMTPTFDVTITLLAYLFCLTSTSVSLLGYLLSTKTVRHSSSCCTLPGRNPLKKGIMFKYRSSQIQLRFSFYVIQEAPSKWRKRKKEKILGLDIKKRKGNQSTRRRTNSPTPTRRRIKSSRDVGELVVNPIQLIRS